MKSTIAIVAAAAALAVPAAAEANVMFADSLSTIYADGSAFPGGTDQWTVANSTLISFERPGINLQIDAAENRLFNGGSGDLFMFGGSLFWRDRDFEFGGTIHHDSISLVSATSFGLFGEWYANEWFTFRARGGGFTGSLVGGSGGGYGGAGMEVYPIDNLGVAVSYNYVGMSGGHLHDVEGHISWQVSNEYPLLITLGAESYGYGSAYSRAFRFGLTYKFGVRGSMLGIDRLATTSWNGGLPGLLPQQ